LCNFFCCCCWWWWWGRRSNNLYRPDHFALDLL
jgi:hypothetical protein